MTRPTSAADSGPTVALVHGAFADSAGWNDVIAQLLGEGVPAVAVSNPLRGIAHDAAYVASALGQIPGSVLTVGHSYGGALVSELADTPGVTSLVYVAAFAPDEGEALRDIEADSKDSVLNSALVPLRYPTDEGDATETEFAINAEKFHDAFAADVSPEQARIMAATQRPISALGSVNAPGRRRGGACRPGRSFRPGTRLRAPTCCGAWPRERARRSPRPRDRTSS